MNVVDDLKWSDVLRYAREGSPEPNKKVVRTDEEWRSLLPPDVYHITRKKGTERPFTGEYCEAHEPGRYACVCCGTLLFDSQTKFESGTGWPSFTQPVAGNVIRYDEDRSYGMHRVEVMCNICDAHLGHVFPDGPPPTGLRYCVNSASLKKV
ncbi:MAG: peptide-methionine (R)-S-oxide reductase MsrB [Cyclobacteriaceae bacterium]|nr:peptide-methionine (R)-S-oxide reductase MsrB [Cyclobacteriaceae bacterium]